MMDRRRLPGLVAAALMCPPVLAQPVDKAAREQANAALVAEAKAHRESWIDLPADDVRAHPDAARFPGSIASDAPRLARVAIGVPLDPIRWRAKARWWHPTGLYAPPGEAISIEVPEDARGAGLFVRVGAHQDNSNPKAASFGRTPANLTHSWALDREQVRVANPFGGPIYIEVPRRAEGPHTAPTPRPTLGATVHISGAVAAPMFVLGRTTPEEWLEARRAPAPWAELVSDHIALTVPSDQVRGMTSPAELMQFWEQSATLVHELGAGEFTAERLVWDPAISAGSMHSGHPIMCQGGLDAIVNLEKLRAGDVWGFFHEMGHNQQYGGWTPKGQGEVTCNWFPMYVRSQGLGLPPFDRAEKWTKPDAPMPRGEIGTANPGGQGHFVALRIWRQIQEEFGWAPFRTVMKEIRAPDYRAPATDEAKWDDLLERFSRATQRDLSPHFVAWGAEVSTPGLARAAALGLPTWAHQEAPGR
jgi:hypothetical protein